MATAKKYSVEQIVAKLRQHEKVQGQGLTTLGRIDWSSEISLVPA
jgi:hypothetical protein